MGWETSSRPGSTRQARTMRARVLREEPVCRTPQCAQRATQDDHIIGWSQRQAAGLTISQWHARSNHQGLCDDCHRAKTQDEARKAKPSSIRRPTRHPGLM